MIFRFLSDELARVPDRGLPEEISDTWRLREGYRLISDDEDLSDCGWSSGVVGVGAGKGKRGAE